MRHLKYNPAFLSAEERASRFGGRQHDLDELLRIVRENSQRQQNQHVLVVGPRGMGKTTLLLRTVDEVRAEVGLSAAWLPLVASEETYRVASIGEFWLEMVFNLERATGDPTHSHVYESLHAAHEEAGSEAADRRLASAALGYLLDVADRQGQRLLLVVENLQMLFGEQLSDRDAWAFREALIGESRIMLLASAVASFEGIDDPKKPLYEQFLIHRLEPLNTDGCVDLWRSLTGERIPKRRMRALEILAGGNPRLLVILAEFAAKLSLQELTADLANLIDNHTDYLKITTEALPPQERKVFVSLAEIWEYASASEVAAQVRLSPSVVSAQLNRLVSKGAVSFRSRGRTKLYRVAERLYSIYHLMRRRGASAARARAATEFMVAYYDESTLSQQMQLIAMEAVKLTEDQREDHLLVLRGLLDSPFIARRREKILSLIPIELSRVLVPLRASEASDPSSGWISNPEYGSHPLFAVLGASGDFMVSLENVVSLLAQGAGSREVAKLLRDVLEAGRPEHADEGAFAFLARACAAGVLYVFEKQSRQLDQCLQFGYSSTKLFGASAHLLSAKLATTAVKGLALVANVVINGGRTGEGEAFFTQGLLTLKSSRYFYQALGETIVNFGGTEDAVARLREWLTSPGADEQAVSAAIGYSIALARAGQVGGVREIIEGSVLEPRLEPLVLALKVLEGLEINAPEEIEEVAKDIVRQIRGDDTLDS